MFMKRHLSSTVLYYDKAARMVLWTPKKMDQAQTVLRMVKANITTATTTQVVRIAMGTRVRCRLRDWCSSRAIKRTISFFTDSLFFFVCQRHRT
jgi:hypothetical protein